MRKLVNIRTSLLGCAIITLCVGAVWVDAGGRRCCPPPPPPCCIVQTIYIEKPGGGAGGGGQRSGKVDPNSEKVHTVIIFDDNAPDIKTQMVQHGNEIQSLVNLNLPITSRGDTKYLNGPQLTSEMILATIKDMTLGPKDVLFVYYTGHGKFVQAEANEPGQGHYFELTKGPISRRDVLKAMKDTPCVLKVLISDSCFKAPSRPDEGNVQDILSQFQLKKKIEKTVNTELLRRLFLEYQGLVDINACKPGEEAFTSIFTPSLGKVSDNWNRAQDDWSAYFEEVSKTTKNEAEDLVKKFKDSDPNHGLVKQGTQTVHSFEDLKQSVKPYDRFTGVAETVQATKQVTPPSLSRKAEPALLRVEVPEAAKLFVEDTPTQQQNRRVRTFETPELPSGQTFHYTLRAELLLEGTLAQVTRKVEIQAGKTVRVDLSALELYKTAAISTTPTVQAATPDVAQATVQKETPDPRR